jgi:hypothetical protein
MFLLNVCYKVTVRCLFRIFAVTDTPCPRSVSPHARALPFSPPPLPPRAHGRAVSVNVPSSLPVTTTYPPSNVREHILYAIGENTVYVLWERTQSIRYREHILCDIPVTSTEPPSKELCTLPPPLSPTQALALLTHTCIYIYIYYIYIYIYINMYRYMYSSAHAYLADY